MLKTVETSKEKHYIAKEPTQQPKFLQKYPSYDGRGIIIAIVDSCIDVSLPGLQQTTTGLPKIIDCFDLTENGDVDTSAIREADSNGILIGLTGRRLKIPSTWKNPSEKWHLGIKSIYELCDKDTLDSIIEFRKERICNKNRDLKKQYKCKTKTDQKFMQKYLKSTENLANYSLVADCIVWFDGQKWQACIDASFSGDLESAKVLTNYRDCHEYGIILDRLSYCVTIHENGNLLEIYATYIDHGTLIANVAAAHYPNEPEKDGLAPGAQIVSFAAIDSRGDMKGDPNATVKAFKKCLEMKVDVISYSMGGFSEDEYPLMKEMVEKHGIIIVKAAGNDGPAYSSLYYLKPCLQNLIFQIGSCLTSDMVKALHETDVVHPPIPSYFSSCGPIDSSGACGITFLAPGHGIADVPKCIAKKYRMFEATSYCAPNAAGAIACVLSGLKARAIPISFFKLKLALTNTAYVPNGGDRISYGNGILQIHDAFEFYIKTLKKFPSTIRNVVDESVDKTGIIIREAGKIKAVYNKDVKINVINTLKKAPKFSWNLKVSSEIENFVGAAMQSNSYFSVKINAKGSKPNSVNYAEIHGYDSLNRSWGPLFKFPLIKIFIPELSMGCPLLEICIVQDTKFPECTKYQLEIQFLGIAEYYPSDLAKFMSYIPFLSLEKLRFKNNLDDIKDVSVSMEFNKIVFKLLPTTAECMTEKGTKLLKLTFNLTVPKTASYCFKTEASDFKWFQDYSLKRFQIFTLSKKFIIGFSYYWDGKVTLKPGVYEIIGLYEYYAINIFAAISFLNFELYELIVIMDLQKPIKPKLYLKESILKSSEILPNTQMATEKNQWLKMYYKTPSIDGITASLPWHSCLQGTLKMRFDGTHIEFKEEQYYYRLWESAKNFLNSVTENLQRYLWHCSSDVKNAFKKITENEVIKWQNTISNLYLTQDYEKLINVADDFLMAVNYKQFLPKLRELDTSAPIYEQKLIELYKSTITDALFVKANFMLAEHLKCSNNVPSIFKNNFGLDIISIKYNEKKKNNPSIFHAYLYLLRFNLYLKSNNFVQIQPQFSHSFNKIELQTFIISNTTEKSHLQKALDSKKKPNYHNKEACTEFLQWVNDTDIQKYLILIKQALIFGELGKALFYLNKVSTENQSLPEFKIFDEAIIELLKKLGWKHLIEAHENALLDRHRNYYRPF